MLVLQSFAKNDEEQTEVCIYTAEILNRDYNAKTSTIRQMNLGVLYVLPEQMAEFLVRFLMMILVREMVIITPKKTISFIL